jgi:hypothetical protein
MGSFGAASCTVGEQPANEADRTSKMDNDDVFMLLQTSMNASEPA